MKLFSGVLIKENQNVVCAVEAYHKGFMVLFLKMSLITNQWYKSMVQVNGPSIV